MDLMATRESDGEGASAHEEHRALRGAESSHRGASRREGIDMMVAKFGIDAALVSVPKLSKVLGIAPSTLYSYIKAGKFFMPHRMVNQSPMVTIDDLIDWYQGRGAEVVSGRSMLVHVGSSSKRGSQPISMDESSKVSAASAPLATHVGGAGEAMPRKEPAKFASMTDLSNPDAEREARDREVDGWVAKAMAAIGQQSKDRKRPASRH